MHIQPKNLGLEKYLLHRLFSADLFLLHLSSYVQCHWFQQSPCLGHLQKAGALQYRAAEHARGHPALWNAGVSLPESLMGMGQVCLWQVSLQNFQKGSTENLRLAKHISNATEVNIASLSMLLMASHLILCQGAIQKCLFWHKCVLYTVMFILQLSIRF